MGGVDEHKGAEAGPPQGLSSSEVNFLVYRYLLESGFGHAAFAFGNESDVNRVDVRGKDVPVGALVSFIQKGFQLVELEANLNANGTDVYGKYVQFSANDILTKDLGELRRIAEEIQDVREGGSGEVEKEEASPSKGGKKGKKNKRAKVEVSALEGANGVAIAEGALPPLEVEMDVDAGDDDGEDGRGDGDKEDGFGNVGVGDAGAVVAPRSTVSSPGTEVAPCAAAVDVDTKAGDVKEEEKTLDVKSEGEAEGDVEVEVEVEDAVARQASQPSSPVVVPSPPPPEQGEQMDVDDSVWDKQRPESTGADDKNENAPFEANGVDTIPPPPPE